MKIIYLFIAALFLSSFTSVSLEDWDKTGHRTVGEIAEQHLTRKAKRNIDKLLNGESLAVAAYYADEIKSDDRYREYYYWHFVNFPFDSTYEEHPKSEKGDLYVAINTCVKILKDDTSSQGDKVFHLKLLAHFMGDLHQPLHVGISEDRGGNEIKLKWFNNETNLHRVWDQKMIGDYNMSYTELAANQKRLTNEELKEIQKGTVRDWMYESRDLCKKIYATTKAGDKLSYRYSYDYLPVVRDQLQKGGIRLAVLLNEIFG